MAASPPPQRQVIFCFRTEQSRSANRTNLSKQNCHSHADILISWISTGSRTPTVTLATHRPELQCGGNRIFCKNGFGKGFFNIYGTVAIIISQYQLKFYF